MIAVDFAQNSAGRGALRTREAEQKNRFEQMRVGLLYTRSINQFGSHADSDAVTLTLGYRF